ncbi:RIP homotypic interaction motif-containing protein [Amycolatopsis sp. NPDC003865]
MTVDAVELVVTALMAGAAAGVKDTATTAVKDSYASLQNAVRRLLIRGSEADVALLETPVEHRPELVTALTAAGAADDHDVLIAAQTLLAQLGQAGKYDIQINDSQGIQVGDGNTMHLRF